MANRKKILVAPMNWGLGHASRCVPVVHALLVRGAEVILAAEGGALHLLQQEFPQLRIERLGGYQVRYGNGHAFLQVAKQLPSLSVTIAKENRWLHDFVKKEKPDAIISDNRYGLHCKGTVSVFITHQTGVQLPAAFKRLEKKLYQLHKKFIAPFDACWIPDYEGEENLSGLLSHQFPPPAGARYIGPLSRFSFAEAEAQRDVLMLLSGPEPQRTGLEKMLRQQALKSAMKIRMVRGVPGNSCVKNITGNFSCVDFLSSAALRDAILTSRLVVARSGYSTLMDLAATRSRAVLIPTPGQTEQEYLAAYHLKKKHWYAVAQQEFQLNEAFEAAADFTGFGSREDCDVLNEPVERLFQLLG